MRTLSVMLALLFVVMCVAQTVQAEKTDADTVILKNVSSSALSISQKVQAGDQILPGGWEQDANSTYNEQYMLDGSRLRFIEIFTVDGAEKTSLFKKDIPAHLQAQTFTITVNADKTVTFSVQ